MERVEEVPAGLVDAGGPRTAAAEQGHAAAHSCGSLRGHACGGGADPQYQRQTAGATVDAPTAARRVGHARRLVPTPAHAAKVHKPAWASTQKRGQLPMRWSSESGKKTCSQVDASTEAGFMHSYVVGHIGLDPSQPSILRNGDRGRRESSRQVPVRHIRLIGAQPQVFYYRVSRGGDNPRRQRKCMTGNTRRTRDVEYFDVNRFYPKTPLS